MQLIRLFAGLALLGTLSTATPGRAQKAKSVPFSYVPGQGEDRYDLRVPQKTLPLPDGSFVILAHQTGSAYAVERYDAALKKQWTATVPVAPGETLEAFSRNAEQAVVVIHHTDEAGQRLTAQPVALAGGQLGAPVVLVAAPARDRRPAVRFSPDGNRVLAFRYAIGRDEQVRALVGTFFDQKLTKTFERTYDFRDQGDFFTPNLLLANDGTQYATLVSDGMRKLTARRYPPTADRVGVPTTIPVMGVPVGGTFGGQPVTIRDARFGLLADGELYAAAICANLNSGELTGLKVVRFDFASQNLKLAPELPFSAPFLAEVGKATGTEVKRLTDVYLGDLLLTPEKNLLVLAERHYEEGGPELPVHARELYVFGYNSYLAPSWHLIIPKDQVAPAVDAYTGIGYRAAIFGEELQLLTLENLQGKSDLYLRRIQAPTGVLSPPQRLKLNVSTDQSQFPYVKDFTGWPAPKTIIAVSRINRKSAALQLHQVSYR